MGAFEDQRVGRVGKKGEQKKGRRCSSWEEEGESEDTASGGMLGTREPVVRETDPACAERRKHSTPASAVFRKSCLHLALGLCLGTWLSECPQSTVNR